MIRAEGGPDSFPGCILRVLQEHLETIDQDVSVVQRPLGTLDGIQMIGIFPDRLEPDTRTFEIGGVGPTIEKYVSVLHILTKDFDGETGQADLSLLMAVVVDLLYNDATLRDDLSALVTVSRSGEVKKSQKWGLQNIKYLSNEWNDEMFYLGTLEFYVDVEKRNG